MIKRFLVLIAILVALTLGLYCLEWICYLLGSLTPGENLFWLDEYDKGYRIATVLQGFVYLSIGFIGCVIVIPMIFCVVSFVLYLVERVLN